MFFEKYHALGNDFVIIQSPVSVWDSPSVQEICDRHKGIGADGLILAIPPKIVHPYLWTMAIYNADGSRAEMCGNGIRAMALWLHRHHYVNTSHFQIHTDVGPKDIHIFSKGEVQADLGTVVQNVHHLRALVHLKDQEGKVWTLERISVGNPHAISWINQSPTLEEARKQGHWICHHEIFPQQTNVEFAEMISTDPPAVRVLVYERGCGLTQACGTGAAATATSMVARHPYLLDQWIDIHLPGGVLKVSIYASSSQAWNAKIKSPVHFVFRGFLHKEVQNH